MNAIQCSGLFLITSLLMITSGKPTFAQSEQPPFDVPMRVNGIEVVCNGVGITARDDPQWATYPLKVEVVGAGGQYLGNVVIVVEREEERIVDLHCAGPWILARLEPGAYTVTATFEGANASGSVNVPATGQGRIILRFPEAGGATSPEHVPSPG